MRRAGIHEIVLTARLVESEASKLNRPTAVTRPTWPRTENND
jgi:hypothetical protein